MFSNVLSPLWKWEPQGIKVTRSGTILICQAPHVAPQAWLHELYSGLNIDEIMKMEIELRKSMPEDLKLFYKEYNGLNIFSDNISIWGHRFTYVRSGEESYQPYDLVSQNEELTHSIPSNWLAIGSYCEDGSCVFVTNDTKNSELFRCHRDTTEIVNRWDSIQEWLKVEIQRLSKGFDNQGMLMDENFSLLPDLLEYR